MKKLVVFDLDGTLVNSIYDIADCVNLALSSENLPQNSLKEYYTFVGNGMENLIRRALKDKSEDENLYKAVRTRFDILYKEHCNDKTTPYEGVPELLQRLNSQGIMTAVLTNKAHEFVTGILHRCFPDHRFHIALGNKDCIARKPDPHGLLYLIEEAGVSLSDCVYVGDSEVDVATAENAGMDLVCVTWGFRSVEELVSSGAKVLISSAEELYNTIINM